eukprot:tig00021254_g19725.t1
MTEAAATGDEHRKRPRSSGKGSPGALPAAPLQLEVRDAESDAGSGSEELEAAKPLVKEALDALDGVLERLRLSDPDEEEEEAEAAGARAVDGPPPRPTGPAPARGRAAAAPGGPPRSRSPCPCPSPPAAPPKALAASLTFPQAAPPPYRLEGRADPAALLALLDLQSRLARALADARLLNLPLFRTLRGRTELRAHFALLRRSGPSAPASSPLSSAPSPRRSWRPAARPAAWGDAAAAGVGAEGGDGAAGAWWAEEDADVLVEHCWALVRAGTTDTPRACPELFPLDWPTAERLALRADELSLPFERAPGALRAKALCFRAFLLDTWKRDEEAVPAYFVAWSELRRRQLAPSPLEAALVPRLAQLLFEAFNAPTALAVRESAYRLAGTDEENVLAELEEIRMTISTNTWRKNGAGAEAEAARGVALLEGLEARGLAEYTLLRARMQLDLGLTQMLQGHPRALAATWTRALRAILACCGGDPGAPELDVLNFLHYARRAQSRASRVRAVRLCTLLLERADKEQRTPLLAHAHFRLARTYAWDGQPKQAARQLRRALAAYTTRFGDVFSPTHPRVVEIERALEALAKRLPAGSAGSSPPAGSAGSSPPSSTPRRPLFSLFSRKSRRVSPTCAAAGAEGQGCPGSGPSSSPASSPPWGGPSGFQPDPDCPAAGRAWS